MPYTIETSPLWKAHENLRTALAGIDTASGYNTRPVLLDRYAPPDSTGETDLPAICTQIVSIETESEVFGPQSFTDDLQFGVIVWAYIRDEVNVQRAAMAIADDILAAIWVDETRGDVAVLTNVLGVDFDVALMQENNMAIVAVRLIMVIPVQRGG